ncbi:MAG TPA: Ig-like domain-containing protein [Acidimicrobiales bacterium]|nr:Ig-like domain-containing protein [Acidimicrobiales bacterium]
MAAIRGKHAKKPSLRALAVVVAVAVVVVGGVVAGLSMTKHGSVAKAAAPVAVGHAQTTTTSTVPLTLSIQPPDGAIGLPLDVKVAVTASTGHLMSVSVSSPDGKVIPGSVDATGLSWQSTSGLAPKTKYTVTAKAAGLTGPPVEQSSAFTTLTPKTILSTTVFPTQGLTVGIGEPIQLRFNHSVVNKAAVVAALQVTESVPVPGGWHWFSDKELHFRPQTYWPANEQVTLTANLQGVDAGNGVWAAASQTINFTVGNAQVSTADVASHVMTVTSNGQVVKTMPLSAGRNQYPTMNGVHIALYRQQDVLMDSQTVGIPRDSPDGYYEHVFWDVAITDGGEFVHAAPWSTGAQGRSNVSHGCINLSVANATWFFGFSHVGDIIQVTGSPRAASLTDHGTMDWNLPLDQWTAA